MKKSLINNVGKPHLVIYLIAYFAFINKLHTLHLNENWFSNFSTLKIISQLLKLLIINVNITKSPNYQQEQKKYLTKVVFTVLLQ